jgi:uncharacterized membrane protein YcaP (DUF421 family)
MRFIDKIFFAEKITTINLAKIIHRIIITFDLRVSHTIIIIIILIVINLTPRSLIARSSPLYFINSRGKIVS